MREKIILVDMLEAVILRRDVDMTVVNASGVAEAKEMIQA